MTNIQNVPDNTNWDVRYPEASRHIGVSSPPNPSQNVRGEPYSDPPLWTPADAGTVLLVVIGAVFGTIALGLLVGWAIVRLI